MIRIGLTTLLTVFTWNVFSATDGDLNSTSDGNISVSMNVNTQIRITGLENIVLADPNTDGVYTGSDSFCVGTNVAVTLYRVTLDMPSETAFVLAGNSTDDLNFTPTYSDGVTSASGFVESLELLTIFTSILTNVSGICLLPNATLSIATEDATGKASASFSGTINILVDPV